FGRLINIVEAAEMLNFVDTPKRLVVLDAVGKRFVQATLDERQVLWREQLLNLQMFREIYETLCRQPNGHLERDFVLETIILSMPEENYERSFDTFIQWGRFGNLFAYDDTDGILSLQ
ncbi:MAG TPA: AAA-associated domain-containing protein, partial [Lacipirellulaceae bacterium]|nr:AAA-associated domain-containing protein [Lacipirellulaceae bacterium]